MIMSNNLEKGNEVEDLVEVICTKMFFSDFVVRNPLFMKPSGKTKEAADFLVPFGDTLLAFQVKSKTETKSAIEKTEIDFGRIHGKVNNAIDQLKTTKRALRNERFTELTTTKGYNIPFDSNSIEKTIGLVIIDLIGEEQFPKDERTAIYNGFDFRHDMPIHIFMREDFEIISSEIDTMPDFLEFLNVREYLLSNQIIYPITNELVQRPDKNLGLGN